MVRKATWKDRLFSRSLLVVEDDTIVNDELNKDDCGKEVLRLSRLYEEAKKKLDKIEEVVKQYNR